MNNQQINKALKIYNDCYIGSYPSNLIPIPRKTPAAIIINTDPSHEPGEHWVVIWLNVDDTCEYFDSFGMPPLNSEIINYINQTCPNGMLYSNLMLQHPFGITCAKYCILYVKMRCRGYSMTDFLQLFSKATLSNDEIIENLYKHL